MPSIRSGFGSDFVLKNEKIGIGSTTPTSALDVAGAIKGDFAIAGVATLTSYGGFVAQNQHINKASSIGFATVGVGTFQQYYEIETGFTDLGGVHHGDDQKFNTLSEDLIIDDGQILNITNIDMVGVTTIGEYDPHSHESYVCAGSLEQVSVTDHFSVPSGGSNDRQSFIEGTVRFNTDLNTLEFFNGNEWRQFTYNQGQSGRGVFAGGNPGVSPLNRTDSIDFIQVSTLGNSQNFGTLVSAKDAPGFGSVSNGSRGVFMSGWQTPAATNEIDYITIASEGNAVDFGNMNTAVGFHAACSSSTRGITMGGYPNTNDIQYIEIATTGNALDFGNLGSTVESNGGLASPTRGISAAGMSPNATSVIEVITIASKGDALIFGDLIQKKRGVGTVSSATRGIFAGGLDSPTHLSSIEFITIASNGNGTDFGDLTLARRKPAGASNSTRGVFAYGYVAPSFYNTMDYITIASAGNAQDFGDGSGPLRNGVGYCSDSHGGLGGF